MTENSVCFLSQYKTREIFIFGVLLFELKLTRKLILVKVFSLDAAMVLGIHTT